MTMADDTIKGCSATRPFVNVTASRTRRWMSHPAAATAGVMNLVQLTRSLSAVKFTMGLL